MKNIRKLRPSDRAQIYEILQQSNMFTSEEISVAMELIDINLFQKNQKDYFIYIARDVKDKVLGYVCYGPTPATEYTYDLYWIAVSPEMQNLGIGKKLLQFVEKQIYQNKGQIIIIETSSQKKYEPTQNFYLKNNYKLEARINDFYRPGDDRLIFVKRLKQ